MISVLLPYRNAAPTLGEAASSVLADMGERDELVLVDDGSADSGPSIAAAFAERDRRVVPVATGGVGIARALGHGLDVCRGEWIARMDADDVSLPGRLEAQRLMLETDSNLGVVAAQVDAFGAAGPGIQRYVEWQNGLVSAEDHAREIFVESPVCHPSTMIRRAAIDAVGGFLEGPFAEDYDLWLRLAASGWSIAKVPRVLLKWRIHDRNTTWNDPRLSIEALRRLRARHLAKRIERPFGVWGAGNEGRRLARELAAHDARASFFIDIDPRKLGRTAFGAPIVTPSEGIARARGEGMFLVVAVAVAGARDVIRPQLGEAGFVEGPDFVCAA